MLLVCLLLLLLDIDTSFLPACYSNVSSSMFMYLGLNLLGFPILLPDGGNIGALFTTFPYSMLAIGLVILPSLCGWVTPPCSMEHDGFIGGASKHVQSGSILTLRSQIIHSYAQICRLWQADSTVMKEIKSIFVTCIIDCWFWVTCGPVH